MSVTDNSVRKLDSHNYELDIFEVGSDGLQKEGERCIKLGIVRGSSVPSENKEHGITAQNGILTEQLLTVCKEYLESVNVGAFRNRDSSIAITNIENALLRLKKRSDDRAGRGVLGTYQK